MITARLVRAVAMLPALLVSAVILLAPGSAAAQMKIAVIDMQRAIEDTEDGMRMKSRLTELMDSRQSEYEGKEKDYLKAKEELERLAKEGKTPEAQLRNKYMALEKLALELQAQGMAFRREMNQKQTEMMTPIVNKLNALVRQVASQDGYDVVVSKVAVPFFRGDLEITDKVIQLYNASTPAAPADDKKPKKDKKGAADKKQAPSPDAPSPDAPKAPEKKPAAPPKKADPTK
jgi:outer membrane protein